MASWTTLTDPVLAAGKPFTQAICRALRDNVIAAFEKQAGAPVLANNYIVPAMLSAAAVTQSKLATSTHAISSSATSATLFTLNGGEYGFYPRIRMTVGTPPGSNGFWSIASAGFLQGDVGASYLARITMHVTTAGSGEAVFAEQRYITASPPYAPFVDGDYVPLFVFGLLDMSSGRIIATSVAIDPPWANNGPTVINPLGRIARMARARAPLKLDQLGIDQNSAAQFEQQSADLWEYMHDTKNSADIVREMGQVLTQAEKNADMVHVPHPFQGNDMAGKRVVLINPTDDRFCRGLAARHEYLGDSVAEILHGNYLIIDNSPMPRIVPPSGVIAVRARWK